jgi:hypothetical protein
MSMTNKSDVGGARRVIKFVYLLNPDLRLSSSIPSQYFTVVGINITYSGRRVLWPTMVLTAEVLPLVYQILWTYAREKVHSNCLEKQHRIVWAFLHDIMYYYQG